MRLKESCGAWIDYQRVVLIFGRGQSRTLSRCTPPDSLTGLLIFMSFGIVRRGRVPPPAAEKSGRGAGERLLVTRMACVCKNSCSFAFSQATFPLGRCDLPVETGHFGIWPPFVVCPCPAATPGAPHVRLTTSTNRWGHRAFGLDSRERWPMITKSLWRVGALEKHPSIDFPSSATSGCL